MSDYANLDRAGQIRRIRSEVISTYRECGLAVKACRILEHQHNTTFRVELETGELNFVRVSRIADRPVSRALSEIEWLCSLVADDFPVVRPIKWDQRVYMKKIEEPKLGEPCILTRFEWIKGKAIEKPSCARWRTIGEVMARLHGFTSLQEPSMDRHVLVPMSENEQCSENGLRIADEVLGKSDRRVLEQVVAVYLNVRQHLGTPQLIHGNIHWDNVLFQKSKMTLVDFEECGFAPPIYDFCTPVRTLRRAGLKSEEEALLEGYQSVLPLPIGFGEHLPVLINRRSAQLIFYLLKDIHDPRSGAFFEEICRKKMGQLRLQA